MTKNPCGPLTRLVVILLFSSAFPVAVSAQIPLFNAHKDYPSGYSPVSIAIGDMNGDSVPDLVTANDSDKTVAVLLGSGDGTFQPPRVFSLRALGGRTSVVAIESGGYRPSRLTQCSRSWPCCSWWCPSSSCT